MSDRPGITAQEASQVWQGYKETKKIVRLMIKDGWTIERSGKHYKAHCPCGFPAGPGVNISCSPQNDDNHARRLGDAHRKCPDRHEYLR